MTDIVLDAPVIGSSTGDPEPPTVFVLRVTPPIALTIRQASEAIGHKTTHLIRNLIDRGELKAVRPMPDSDLLVPESELRNLFDKLPATNPKWKKG